jgi:N,N'-diacetyllegionaminate synthase
MFKKTIIIAEVAQEHNSSLKKALRFIDKSAKAGADYVKFQMHIAECESTFDEPFRKGFNFKDKSRYEYWKRMEFSLKNWEKLINRCKERKIGFLCSPFSIEAFKRLRKFGLRKWKIGSGEFFSDELLHEIIKNKDKIILSTGLANLNEIKKRVYLLKKNNIDFCLLQCVTKYPNPLKTVGINVIKYFKKKYNCKVGLSDHSGKLSPSLYSIFNSYDIIELHLRENNSKEINPDTTSSVCFDELEFLCKIRDEFLILQKNNVNKNLIAKKLFKTRKLFTKSLCVKKNLSKGEILNKNNLCEKKPGTGIPYKFKYKLIGKKALKNISSNKLLKLQDLS